MKFEGKNRRLKVSLQWVFAVTVLSCLFACSPVKHVPDGQYLLDNVYLKVEGNTDVKASELKKYLRQTPNTKTLGLVKTRLLVYSLSKRDSTSRFHRWLRKLGTAPVIYDSTLTKASVQQLTMALQNRGYMHSVVTADTFSKKKKRMNVTYHITPGEQYFINNITYNIASDSIRDIILEDTLSLPIRSKSPFDRNALEQERVLITQRMRNKGYYAFTKEHITFVADTASGSIDVNIELNVQPPRANASLPYYDRHRPFRLRNITVITNYEPGLHTDLSQYQATDTVHYHGLTILYGKEHYLRESVLDECNFLLSGDLYNVENTEKTYKAFQRLGILKSINVNFQPVGEFNGEMWLDAYICTSKMKSQNVSVSLEGTNSNGDLGFGVGLTYQHYNIGKGSELLTAKAKVSYESISGDISGFVNNRNSEYSAEVGVTLPKFIAPFLSKRTRQRVLSTTNFTTSFSYQERPEYTRIIAGLGWNYNWSNRAQTRRNRIDFIDLYYVNLPKIKSNFLDSISNPILRNSYENHFILRTGYTLYLTNKKSGLNTKSLFQPTIYTFRISAELAGNLLYGLSKLFHFRQDDNGIYKILNIAYSQYFKANADYSITHKFNTRHSLAFRVGAGVGVPYGNSQILPFEKRFYSGGANSVRGWNVRTLGPGSYKSSNSVSNYINQCGDIRFDLSLEYRAKVFWVIELAAFIDAGNVWTIRSYENQEGGVFKVKNFFKELAASYGFGIRLDFSYFLIRFDLGLKAHNPAQGEEPWPILHPNWKRDHAFHFSIGYPF